MPTIAIFAIFAIVLVLTSDSKEPKTELPTTAPDMGDDPTDLLAQALDAYIKDKKKPRL